MSVAALLALYAAAAVNAVVPGPGMMLAVGRSAARGFGAGAQVSLGMALATLLLMAVVWAMMAGAVVLSPDGITVLRAVGVAVLVGLALVMLFGAPAEVVARPGLMAGRLAAGRLGAGHLGDVAGGLATGLSSPVHLVFLLALLPQFVDLAAAGPRDLFAVAAGVLVITTVPMLLASALGAHSGRLGLGWSRHVTRASGVALLGFAGLALGHAP